MNHFRYFVISSILLLAVLPAFNSSASPAPRKDHKTKSEMKKEIKDLRYRLDSLESLVKDYEGISETADSLASVIELMEEENNVKIAAPFFNPGEYTAELTDSLLNLWYLHSLGDDKEDAELCNLDSARFTSDVPDEVYIERIKAMNSYITVPYNDIVRNYIILYSEKRKSSMSRLLGLCKYYMPIFKATFDRYGLPEELCAMSIIESALNPLATSRAGAKGMWQFMYNVAKSYGLQIDSFVDERMDVEKSVDAAARYLRDSYNIFGDWSLAISSYNCGAGNVKKAMRRSGGRTAFWDIYPYLPRETRGYVPAFVGALYTMTYYKEHGIVPDAMTMPAHVDTIKVNRMLHFKQISDVAGIPMDELRNLNPQYKHDIVPANGREYILKIPYTYTDSFIQNEDSIYLYMADSLLNKMDIKKIVDGGDGERVYYKVKSGDSLGKIANRYHVSVEQLKKWNRLKNSNIRIGQRLVVGQRAASASPAVSRTPAAPTAEAQAPAASQADPAPDVRYTVKSGDSLYIIAKKFPGVTVDRIIKYNGLKSSTIHPGMVIKIPR